MSPLLRVHYPWLYNNRTLLWISGLQGQGCAGQGCAGQNCAGQNCAGQSCAGQSCKDRVAQDRVAQDKVAGTGLQGQGCAGRTGRIPFVYDNKVFSLLCQFVAQKALQLNYLSIA